MLNNSGDNYGCTNDSASMSPPDTFRNSHQETKNSEYSKYLTPSVTKDSRSLLLAIYRSQGMDKSARKKKLPDQNSLNISQ